MVPCALLAYPQSDQAFLSGALAALGPWEEFQSSQPRTHSFPGRDMAALSLCSASCFSTCPFMSCACMPTMWTPA